MAPSGGQEAALTRLPLAALRLPEETLDGLRLMGIEQIGALAALPRAPLVRRFGALVTTRLDQAFGRVAETIEPEFPPELVQARLTFVEPLLTAEAFAIVIDRLIRDGLFGHGTVWAWGAPVGSAVRARGRHNPGDPHRHGACVARCAASGAVIAGEN